MFLLRLLSVSFAIISISHAVFAEQVTLKSNSSPIELIGELISFNNETYVIETDLGQLEVDARTVTCTGSACPNVKNIASVFSISGNQTLINRLLIPLLESYSYSLDADIETTIETNVQSRIRIIANDGQEFAKISVQETVAANSQAVLKITSGTPKAVTKSAENSNVVPIAADALVAITSDINPVKSISFIALQNILTGTITNWKEVGGPDAKINIYLPDSKSQLSEIANRLGYNLSKAKDAERFNSLEALSKATVNDPYGLGITSFANRRTANALPILGACGAYLQPNIFNISSGNYPTTFYYYLETATGTLPVFAREFLGYLGKSQAKAMIGRQGYASLSIHENSLDNQGNRIAHGLLNNADTEQASDFRSMLQNLNGARQLSTVLRFDKTGAKLTPQSNVALESLISELFLGNFADQTLIIAGFTDSVKSLAESKLTSKSAATVISNIIKNADDSGLLSGLQVEVMGYGKISPLLCENTSEGAITNNRVEIWVKDNN